MDTQMTRQQQAKKLALVKIQATTHQRVKIAPRAEVKVATAAQREEVVTAVRRVIAEHRDVLIALKDR